MRIVIVYVVCVYIFHVQVEAGIEGFAQQSAQAFASDLYIRNGDTSGPVTCLLDLLDTAGQEEYSGLRDQYYRTAQGFVLVFSLTSHTSFQEAKAIHEQYLRCRDAEWYVNDGGGDSRTGFQQYWSVTR